MYDLESPPVFEHSFEHGADHSAGRSGYRTIETASGGNYLNAYGTAAGLPTVLTQWLMQSLDHVGRGMLLVGDGGQVLHANRLARSAVAAGGYALQIHQGRLSAGSARDDKLLHEAIHAALHRGLRRMLTLGRGAAGTASGAGLAARVGVGEGVGEGACNATITLAVLPIEDPTAAHTSMAFPPGRTGRAPGHAVLISLPQSGRSKDLAVQIFAREHGCTGAETAVLEALLAGQTPEAVAQAKGVALCTVRTQIGQLRLKTGSHTIRELLDRVAGLPPMMVVVQ